MVRWLLLGGLVGCAVPPPEEARAPRDVEAGETHHRVSESFDVGAHPVTVVLVRHAQPTEVDTARLDELADAWLTALEVHQAPWRLGVLPVGADPATTVLGELLPTASGLPWVDADTLDPLGELTALQRPMPGAQVENPALETLRAFDLAAIALPDSVVLIALVSERDDTAEVWLGGELGPELRDQVEAIGLADVNLDVFTTRSDSTCGTEPEATLLGGLASQAGGREVDICDAGAAERLVEGYGEDLDPATLRLTWAPRLSTVEITMGHPDAPAAWVAGQDFDWDEATGTLSLAWTPPIRTFATVSYELR